MAGEVTAPELRAGIALGEIVVVVAERLAAAGVPCPAADARWLVDGIAGIDPHRSPASPLPFSAVDTLRAAVERRIAREPLQLILGSAPFRSLQLICRPGVFVPRPETEVVAGYAIAAAKACPTPAPTVLEPCTGTGAIACAIAVEVPGAHIVATDIDPAAVRLASENAQRVRSGHGGPPGFAPGVHLTVRQGDLSSGVTSGLRGHLDVLVANPPYLPAADRRTWEPEVAEHDPEGALVGGQDGHELVDALLGLAAAWLAPGGVVVVEIDERRGEDAATSARRAGLLDVEVVADLTGADRAVVAHRCG